MSDLIKLTDMLYGFGILYKMQSLGRGVDSNLPELNSPEIKDATLAIVIDSGIGYDDLMTYFYFDAEGNFICHGVWE
jgi:hypothetical protein